MHIYKHEIRYYECDRMGITHHSNYVRIMEEARIDYLDKLGWGFDKIEADGVVSPVVSIECKYKSPTTFKDIVEVEVSICNMSDLKFEFKYIMRKDGKLVAEGHSVHCFTENGRPVVIAKRLPKLYNRIIKAQNQI